MKLTCYVDYVINVRHGMNGAEVAYASSALFNCLHVAFSQNPGKFAIDFPKKAPDGFVRTSTMRVFAKSIEDHQLLHQFFQSMISNGSLKPGMFSATFPVTVPEDFKGPYRAIYRERIKTRSRNLLRVQKMRELEARNATYINVASNTNGQKFRMYFRIESSDTNQTAQPGQLNSYGMSIFGSPVVIPEIG